jgi:hypothetical protein
MTANDGNTKLKKGGQKENPIQDRLYLTNKNPKYITYKSRNQPKSRTYKRGRSFYIKKSPTYNINVFLSLKKGEPWTEEELKKAGCQKQWLNISHSYNTVMSNTKKNLGTVP